VKADDGLYLAELTGAPETLSRSPRVMSPQASPSKKTNFC
jgi:hypothetical protein